MRPKSFSYKPKTIQSEVIFKLLDWMVLVISSVLFLNVLIRAKRNCHNLCNQCSKSSSSAISRKVPKNLRNKFRAFRAYCSEQNAIVTTFVISVQKAALSAIRHKFTKFKKQISKFLIVSLGAERFCHNLIISVPIATPRL